MRKLLLGLLALSLVLLGATLPLVLPRQCPLSGAACERVTVGMTRVEVEHVLAVPEGDYRTRPVSFFPRCWSGKTKRMWFTARGTLASWVGDEGDLLVLFDAGVA